MHAMVTPETRCCCRQFHGQSCGLIAGFILMGPASLEYGSTGGENEWTGGRKDAVV